jgi:hypothetical protein
MLSCLYVRGMSRPRAPSLLLHRIRGLSVVFGSPRGRLPKLAASRRSVYNDAHVYAAPRHVVRHGSLEGCLRRSQQVYRGRFIQDAVCGLRRRPLSSIRVNKARRRAEAAGDMRPSHGSVA